MQQRTPNATASAALALLTLLGACGGGGSGAVTTTGTTTTTVTPTMPAASGSSLLAGYKQAKWASKVSVTYPSDCVMTITSNGQPNHAIDTHYLEPPIGTYTTVVANASQSGMALVVVPYSVGAGLSPVSFNICPAKAATTTATGGGGIGLMISGPALFNATEGENGKAAALSDNVSYSFTDSTGVSRTAKFIDSCNGHPTPNLRGNTYHYHGLSSCITAQVDVAGGPSHLIGVAADGFPIYGGRDMNGQVITLAQLDACNGITSATPEFPNGVYHYVLPEGVTNFQSSLRCYSGSAPSGPIAALRAPGVCSAPLNNPKAKPGVTRRPQGLALLAALDLRARP